MVLLPEGVAVVVVLAALRGAAAALAAGLLRRRCHAAACCSAPAGRAGAWEQQITEKLGACEHGCVRVRCDIFVSIALPLRVRLCAACPAARHPPDLGRPIRQSAAATRARAQRVALVLGISNFPRFVSRCLRASRWLDGPA